MPPNIWASTRTNGPAFDGCRGGLVQRGHRERLPQQFHEARGLPVSPEPRLDRLVGFRGAEGAPGTKVRLRAAHHAPEAQRRDAIAERERAPARQGADEVPRRRKLRRPEPAPPAITLDELDFEVVIDLHQRVGAEGRKNRNVSW